jgi:hypothetical protein
MSSVSGVATVPASVSGAGSSNEVQLQAAISMQKKSQDLVAEQTRLLIASATGVGTRLDVQG